MTIRPTRSAALAVLAAGVLSAPALAVGPPESTPNNMNNPGASHRPAGTPNATAQAPAPNASPNAQRRAYGRYCADQSKRRVAGQKGTPFSRCVTAMARLASGESDSPREACRTLSKKHVAGQKGTPYSRCVSAAARLQRDQADD